MNDIEISRDKAMIEQKWFFKSIQRIGDPFEWVDGDLPIMKTIKRFKGIMPIVRWFREYDEVYPVLDEIRTVDYEEMKAHYEKTMLLAFKYFAPFISPDSICETAVEGTATLRSQDYCFIKKFCKDIPGKINHLDLGPGLGTHAIYSLKGFNSSFYALEAIPYNYDAQRHFFRFLSFSNGTYLDIVECENFCLSLDEIIHELNDNPEYRIKHVPSWKFQIIKEQCIDLVTATFMLNELSEAGVLWLLSNSSRVLRRGGYFYICDSGKLKPRRHSINYDELLIKMGFVEVKRLNIRHRIDMNGIPRVYQKKNDKFYTFEELVEKCLGHFFAKNLDAKRTSMRDIEL